MLAEAEDQAHLIAALHQCCERLGGVSREWRFDRMATVCQPGTGRVSASFAAVAKYYSALVNICPSQSGWRKGSVEKSNDSAAQRWWRTLADEVSPPRAQVLLDQLSQDKFDARPRRRPDGEKVTVGVLAGEERLRPLPGTPYPAVIEDSRQISPQALVSWKGNRGQLGARRDYQVVIRARAKSRGRPAGPSSAGRPSRLRAANG